MPGKSWHGHCYGVYETGKAGGEAAGWSRAPAGQSQRPSIAGSANEREGRVKTMRRAALWLATGMMLGSLAVGLLAQTRGQGDAFPTWMGSLLTGCFLSLGVLVTWGLPPLGPMAKIEAGERF